MATGGGPYSSRAGTARRHRDRLVVRRRTKAGTQMSHWDVIGYFAAGLVFVAFGMKEMVPLRVVAMLSNLAFVTYGLGLDLTPVWLLHAVLLPLNGWRLAQALRFAGRTTIRIDLVAGEGGLAARKLHRSIAVQREAPTTGSRGETADRQEPGATELPPP